MTLRLVVPFAAAFFLALGPAGAADTVGGDSKALIADMLVKAERAYQAGDYEKAFDLTRAAAEAGDDQAQFNLGVLYSKGHGIPVNYGQAAEWYLKAANQGHRGAMLNLSVIMSEGLAGERDLQFAAELRRMAGQPGEARPAPGPAVPPAAARPGSRPPSNAPRKTPDAGPGAAVERPAAPSARAGLPRARILVGAALAAAAAAGGFVLFRRRRDDRGLHGLSLPQRLGMAKGLSDAGRNDEAVRLLLDDDVLAGLARAEDFTHDTVRLVERAGRLQDLVGHLAKSPPEVSVPFGKALLWVGKTQACVQMLRAKSSLTPAEERLLATASGPEADGPSPDPRVSAPASPRVGTGGGSSRMLAGRYQILALVGEGGMGEVYEGFEPRLDRRVAIKKVRREIRADPRVRQHFIAEAKLIAKANHPYIVSIHDVFEYEDDLFLVLDYVEGRCLSDILVERGRLPLAECKDILRYVCEAVEFAHGKNILHRDLKPGNVMINKEGFALVMDFGLAREAKDTVSRMTSNLISGSPAYMAPEQHLGQSVCASDVYSIGAMLYEMLTGDLPFRGPDFLSQKERRIFGPLSGVVKDLPRGCDEVLALALDPDPKTRISSPAAFYARLKAV
ncbi:MAG: protein kinase [Elusimicrobia bacterium]|nr:protein kinase [Elusimicrobiota bacterium]